MQLTLQKDLSTTYETGRRVRFQRTVKSIPILRSRSLQQDGSQISKFYIKEQFFVKDNDEQALERKDIKKLRQNICRIYQQNSKKQISPQKSQNCWESKKSIEKSSKKLEYLIANQQIQIQAQNNLKNQIKYCSSVNIQDKKSTTENQPKIIKQKTELSKEILDIIKQNQQLKIENKNLMHTINKLEESMRNCTNCKEKDIKLYQLEEKLKGIRDEQIKIQTIKLAALQECLRKTQKELFQMKQNNKHLNIQLNCLQKKFHSKLQNHTTIKNKQIALIKEKYLTSLQLVKQIKQRSKDKLSQGKPSQFQTYDNILELSEASGLQQYQ